MRLAICFVLTAASLLAQQSEKFDPANKVTYSPLARQARIRGTVIFDVKEREVAAFAGHPLLVDSCKETVSEWRQDLQRRGIKEVEIRFELIEPKLKTVTDTQTVQRKFPSRLVHWKTSTYERKTSRQVEVPQEFDAFVPWQNGTKLIITVTGVETMLNPVENAVV